MAVNEVPDEQLLDALALIRIWIVGDVEGFSAILRNYASPRRSSILLACLLDLTQSVLMACYGDDEAAVLAAVARNQSDVVHRLRP